MSSLPIIERYQAPNQASVVTIRFDKVASGWEQWFLLSADRHHDNTHCDHKLEKKHLEEVKARNALIIDVGDMACAMQGKWDPRKSMSQCPPELRVDNYLDVLHEYNSSFYLPYAKHFAMISPGNHEDAIASRHQICLTTQMAKRFREAGSPVQIGTYRGWVRFLFTCQKNLRRSITLHYTHGYGGGGPVTRDVIQAARQLAYLADADILLSAHTHDAWHVPVMRESLSASGRPILKTVDVTKPGTYKDEFSQGSGWATSKGLPPKPLGAYWLRLYFFDQNIHREFIRAT